MGNSPKKDEEVMIKGDIEKKDMSHIISVLQVLYHIPDFKKYFIQKEYNPNSNKHLSIFMDDLVSNKLDQIDFYNEAANVSKILRNKYNLKSAETSGEILIQILMILKYEEKEMKTENWQEYVVKNPSLFNKISNNKSALDDILDLNRDHFNTTFCATFFGIFCAERNFFETNNILYFYNFYCVYELNMPQIYQNLISKGKIMQNSDQLPQVNLIDCLYEMQEPHNETFNNYNCSVKYYMFNAPNILIFFIKSDDTNYETFRGNIIFQEIMDFSQVIQNTQPNNFKLISIINKDRYQSKKKQKTDDKGIKWSESEDNNDDERKPYKAVFRDVNGQFCSFRKENELYNCGLQIYDSEYYHQVIIFMRIQNY